MRLRLFLVLLLLPLATAACAPVRETVLPSLARAFRGGEAAEPAEPSPAQEAGALELEEEPPADMPAGEGTVEPDLALAEEVPAPAPAEIAGVEPPAVEAGEETRGRTLLAQAAEGREEVEGPPPAQTPAEPPSEEPAEDVKPTYVSLNFDNADVYDFIQTIAEITGINYVIAPGVSGRITVQTEGRIPIADILPLFHTLLEINNLAALPTEDGKLYKIVVIEQAKKRMIPLRTEPSLPEEPRDRLVVQIVPLTYISPMRLAEVITRFVSPNGELVPIPSINILLIVDLESNLPSLLSMAKIFDVDVFEKVGFQLFAPQYAKAVDMQEELSGIYEAVGIGPLIGGGGLELIAFERLNLLLAISSTPELISSVEGWVEQLDRETAEVGRQTYVYLVQFQQAENLASLLNQIYVTPPGATQPVARPREAPTARRVRLQEEQLLAEKEAEAGAAEKGTEEQAALEEKRVEAAQPTAAAGIIPAAVAGEVRIVADPVTNALIIQALPEDYRIIEKTIKQLDLKRKQVLIEALIAEITLSDNFQYGLQWTIRHQRETLSRTGGTRVSSSGSIELGTQGTTDLSVIGVSEDFASGLVYRLLSSDIDLLLAAVARQTDVNILSSPHIIASDNQEARISVGDEVPVVTAEQFQTNVDTPFRTIEFRSTGVILTVTPHINSKNLVTLEVLQEVSDAVPTTTSNVDSPTITTRETQTTVLVESGQTLVIGGLISQDRRTEDAGIPYLRDIPLFGRVFDSADRRLERTELIVLITPFVIETREEAEEITREFRKKVSAVQEAIRTFEQRGRSEAP